MVHRNGVVNGPKRFRRRNESIRSDQFAHFAHIDAMLGEWQRHDFHGRKLCHRRQSNHVGHFVDENHAVKVEQGGQNEVESLRRTGGKDQVIAGRARADTLLQTII